MASNTNDGLTAADVDSIRPGTYVQFNLSVHCVTGPDPAAWLRPVVITEVTKRGVTAACHPKGGGRPWISYRRVTSVDAKGEPCGWECGSIATGDRHVRIVREEA